MKAQSAASVPVVPRSPEMRRLVASLLAFCILCLSARAQFASDTSAAFRASQLIAPAALFGGAAVVHFMWHEDIEIPVYEYFSGRAGDAASGISVAGDICRFVPSALHLGLGLTGVRAKRPFADRVIESAIAHSICVGCGYAAKYAFRVMRPDGSDNLSFPSGHSVVAFTGAELMRLDYGNAIGSGAYVFSSAVAVSRLYAGRHWLSDILAGAGLGILSAHAGAWLLEPVKSLFGLPDWSWDGLTQHPASLALMPGADPLSGAPTACLNVVF